MGMPTLPGLLLVPLRETACNPNIVSPQKHEVRSQEHQLLKPSNAALRGVYFVVCDDHQARDDECDDYA